MVKTPPLAPHVRAAMHPAQAKPQIVERPTAPHVHQAMSNAGQPKASSPDRHPAPHVLRAVGSPGQNANPAAPRPAAVQPMNALPAGPAPLTTKLCALYNEMYRNSKSRFLTTAVTRHFRLIDDVKAWRGVYGTLGALQNAQALPFFQAAGECRDATVAGQTWAQLDTRVTTWEAAARAGLREGRETVHEPPTAGIHPAEEYEYKLRIAMAGVGGIDVSDASDFGI